MMRLYKNVAVILMVGCCAGFLGCEKFLDEKTNRKLAVPATLQDFQALLDHTDMNVSAPSAGEISSDAYYLTDKKWAGLESENQRRMYIWEKENLFNTGYNDWNDTYKAIYTCNTVLSGIPQVKRTAVNAAEWDNVKGQALYCRGNNYLDAVIVWSLAYDQTTASIDLGLPLRLNTDFNEVSVRSSVRQTYEQIIQDIKGSIHLLPLVPLSKFRPSRAAAYGLLARTYLSMRDYENAGQYADSCLALNENLLDYNTLKFTGNYPIVAANNTEALYFRFMSFSNIIYNNLPIVTPEIYNSYAPDDLRKQAFFKKNTDNTFWFRGSYGGNYGLFCGIATNEIFLIKSECLARMGKVTESMNILNKLLVKRWSNKATYMPYTASGTDDALKVVLAERRKELVMNSLRWMDIKRLNKEGASIKLTRNLNGKVYELAANDLRFALPIPEDVIALSGMIQNRR
ncbi:hypothetical protein TH53_08725 [Pedobacter lusitanus]|uniref:Contig33, whole genome shotgun sequence n=1 Tax=Pedobacter lusitanus TaxID=1503925 RepID=A0A0D0GJR3_9SPHI|nr:RagB/SusD family nutrient uptake outer membrane protein [Pedobacter lusitanus]KIO77517.1 hypothetical protein TH53_08725 [Pedobacter lusitanus]